MTDRIEKDSLGEVRVPEGALYGAQTQRAVENFPISGRTMPSQVIRALARIKASCAAANRAIGRLDAERASIIRAKALEIAAGEYAEHFPIDVFQTGSGTSTNMNVNEVIAHLASTPELKVHPNDHVNMGQSSNDVIPTAVHAAARDAINEVLEPGLARLAGALAEAARRYDDVVALGRTHTMDAMPRRIGQLLGGHAAMIEAGRARVRAADEALAEVALGGTAVGTGYSAPRAFVDAALSRAVEALRPHVPRSAQSLRRAGRHRRDRVRERCRARRRDLDGEDRRRLALARGRPRRRAVRDPLQVAPARIVDHAGQGEPGDGRGRDPGDRAGHRQ